jgi:hypothetical protein
VFRLGTRIGAEAGSMMFSEMIFARFGRSNKIILTPILGEQQQRTLSAGQIRSKTERIWSPTKGGLPAFLMAVLSLWEKSSRFFGKSCERPSGQSWAPLPRSQGDGWGTWIRTKAARVRAGSSTAKLSPKRQAGGRNSTRCQHGQQHPGDRQGNRLKVTERFL